MAFHLRFVTSCHCSTSKKRLFTITKHMGMCELTLDAFRFPILSSSSGTSDPEESRPDSPRVGQAPSNARSTTRESAAFTHQNTCWAQDNVVLKNTCISITTSTTTFQSQCVDGTQRTTTSDTRHKTTTHSRNMTRRQQTPVKHVYVNCFVSITDHFPHDNNSTNSWKLTRCASLDLFKGEPPQRMDKPSTLPSQMLVNRPLSASVGLDNAHVVHVHKMLHHTSQLGVRGNPVAGLLNGRPLQIRTFFRFVLVVLLLGHFRNSGQPLER